MTQTNTPPVARFFGYVLLLVNLLAALWLCFSYAAAVVHPVRVRHLQLFSLLTPFAIIANVLFVILWLCSYRKWRAVFSLSLLIIFHKATAAIFAFHYWDGRATDTAGAVKLVAWNVHGMGFFDAKGNANNASIIATLQQQHADVLCLSEYTASPNGTGTQYTSRIIKDGGYADYRFQVDNIYGPIKLGIAIFSKYPIIAYQSYQVGPSIYMVQCDVQVRGKIVRLCCMHLYSFMLTGPDMEYIAALQRKRKLTDADIWRSRKLIWKFDDDYTERGNEADSVHRIISQSP